VRGASGSTDFSLVAIEVPLHYAVENVELYERLGPPDHRDRLLEAVGRRAVLRYISGLTVDEVLATRRTTMAETLRARVEAAFAELNPDADGVPMGAGVRVLFVGAEGVHPPKDTAEAFENVVSAQQNREGMILTAEAEAIQTLTRVVGSVALAGEVASAIDELARLRRSGADAETLTARELEIEEMLAEAGGLAAQRLAESRASRWRAHMAARSRAMAFLGQQVAYEAQPTVYRHNTYLRALADALSRQRVIISAAGPSLWLDVNLEQSAATVDAFDPDAVPDP
jgi:regulator of protease activity HflC (stomatin/prohibitin superfamily)